MNRANRSLSLLSLCAVLLAAGSAQAVTTVSTFTGGDPGEGLDLSGNFPYAVNVGGGGVATGPFLIGNANFLTSQSAIPGFSITAPNHITGWTANPTYGATANDDALEHIMRDIRWASAPGSVTMSLDNLQVGKDYKLQLLFTEACCNRGFNVVSEGTVIVRDFSPRQTQGGVASGSPTNGALITHSFTATDTTLNLALTPPSSGFTFYSDNNPIIQGLTLESLGTSGAVLDNVALGKPVIAGSGSWANNAFNVGQYPATKVTDGSVSDINTTNPSNYWLGREQTNNEFFVLDLGRSYDLKEIQLLNTHNTTANDRGTQDFRIFASQSVDGSNNLIGGQLVLQGVLSDTTGQLVITPDIFNGMNGLALTSARYLRFEALNYRAGDVGVGLNEIVVLATVTVPEPASAMLGLFGVAALGLRRRRAA